MARMKPKAVNTSILFDVFYEDGTPYRAREAELIRKATETQ